MADLTPEISAEIVAAAQAGAEEVAGALSRALDAQMTLTVGEASPFDPAALPEGFDGAGLVILLRFGESALTAVLPDASGLAPSWCANPDETGQGKLGALARELSVLLVPETFTADSHRAAWVERISDALAAGEPAADAALVPLSLSAGEKQGALSVIWPFAAHDSILPDAAGGDTQQDNATDRSADDSSSAGADASDSATGATAQSQTRQPPGFGEGLRLLPNYTRSLLRIQVPVTVKLASKKQALSEILNLGPGSIVSFEKGCDELLDMEIGDVTIARGEAVKVGDKFGLRINSIVLPGERFHKVERPRTQAG